MVGTLEHVVGNWFGYWASSWCYLLSGHKLEVDLSDDAHTHQRDYGDFNNQFALSYTP